MSHDKESLRAAASTLVRHGEALYAAGGERRARWLADAFALLCAPEGELGRAARRALVFSSGLSAPMIDWALRSALEPLDFASLRALEASPPSPTQRARRVRPGQLCVVVLAGNIAIGPARAIALPLLYGWPVLAKASSEDDAFARLLATALERSDPELARAYGVVSFGGDHEQLSAALFEQADAVSVYGSDATVNAIRAQVGATVSFIGHGHGLGAALIAKGALEAEPNARLVARRFAFDVAAYDQRGCMSPHVAWVQKGGTVSAERFAELLAAELDQLRTSLPRGSLPRGGASAQLSWRGVSAIRGRLLEGDGYAVGYEDGGSLRVSPGHRNVQVVAIARIEELTAKLAPLGVHLKTLAHAGIGADELLALLPARLAPRLCTVGQMQTPPLDALQDGIAPWDGLLRWAELGSPTDMH
jgi:acyl-CoA reductase-like NAD-dependent aldehyde dehydrogenase